MKRLLFLLVGCVLFIAFANATGCKNKAESTATTSEKSELEKVTEPEPDPTPKVRISTKFGDMVVVLYDKTPKHRDNFVKLVNEKFYDGLLFHRCMKGFMIQGGDPGSRGASMNQMLGTGGPGYTIPAEFNPNLIHKKGALCAARQGDQINPKKESSGSQFYIVQGQTWTDMQLAQFETNIGKSMPEFKYTEEQKELYRTVGGTAQLDMNYTVFGEVIEGLAVIDSINAQPTNRDRPLQDVIMNMEVIKK
jgi:cyclophilin family peptidyl-prolyl cis-trans isomerase